MKKVFVPFLMICTLLLAVSCNKEEIKSYDVFYVKAPNYQDADGSKSHFDYSSLKMLYDENDHILINGIPYNLTSNGAGLWTATRLNGSGKLEAAHYYCMHGANGSWNSGSTKYTGVTLFTKPDTYWRSNNIIAGHTTDSNLVLNSMCAIVCFRATSSGYNITSQLTSAAIAFDANKIYKNGDIKLSTNRSNIKIENASNAMDQPAIVDGFTGPTLVGDKLKMTYDGPNNLYYAVVPVPNGSVTTNIWFEVIASGTTSFYSKTSSAVTIQQGKVYTVDIPLTI